jgi:hypothetical protein
VTSLAGEALNIGSSSSTNSDNGFVPPPARRTASLDPDGILKLYAVIFPVTVPPSKERYLLL